MTLLTTSQDAEEKPRRIVTETLIWEGVTIRGLRRRRGGQVVTSSGAEWSSP